MNTYILDYTAYNKNMILCRAGKNTKVIARNSSESISVLEKILKKRFSEITMVQVTSCVEIGTIERVEKAIQIANLKKR